MSDVGMSDVGSRKSDVGCWMLDVGCYGCRLRHDFSNVVCWLKCLTSLKTFYPTSRILQPNVGFLHDSNVFIFGCSDVLKGKLILGM